MHSEQGVIMNRLDLIINALENSEPTGTGWVHVHEQKHQAALAAARELRALKPVAFRKMAHGMWFYIEHKPSPPNDGYEPLYALDGEQA